MGCYHRQGRPLLAGQQEMPRCPRVGVVTVNNMCSGGPCESMSPHGRGSTCPLEEGGAD